eukprot:jgi/Bigna1/69549/fgenesh1_pg.9_\
MGCALNSGYFLAQAIPNPFLDERAAPMRRRTGKGLGSPSLKYSKSPNVMRREERRSMMSAEKSRRRKVVKRYENVEPRLDASKAEEMRVRQSLFYDSWLEIREALQGGQKKPNARLGEGFGLAFPANSSGSRNNSKLMTMSPPSVSSPSNFLFAQRFSYHKEEQENLCPTNLGPGFEEVNLNSPPPTMGKKKSKKKKKKKQTGLLHHVPIAREDLPAAELVDGIPNLTTPAPRKKKKISTRLITTTTAQKQQEQSNSNSLWAELFGEVYASATGADNKNKNGSSSSSSSSSSVFSMKKCQRVEMVPCTPVPQQQQRQQHIRTRSLENVDQVVNSIMPASPPLLDIAMDISSPSPSQQFQTRRRRRTANSSIGGSLDGSISSFNTTTCQTQQQQQEQKQEQKNVFSSTVLSSSSSSSSLVLAESNATPAGAAAAEPPKQKQQQQQEQQLPSSDVPPVLPSLIPPPPALPPSLLGVPPPPPLVASSASKKQAAAAAAAAAAAVDNKGKAARKMKKLHWTPLRDVKKESIWGSIAEDEEERSSCNGQQQRKQRNGGRLGSSSALLKGLEENFTQQNYEKKRNRKSICKIGGGMGQKGAAGSKKKKQQPTLFCIDERRACNVNIGLAGIKLPLDTIARAVKDMNQEVLDGDILARLVKIFPTSEELKQLRRFKGDAKKLDKAEQYFLAISKTPQPHARLQILLLMSEFPSRIQSITARLDKVSIACDKLTRSASLKKVLMMLEGRSSGLPHFYSPDPQGKDRKVSLLQVIVTHIMDTDLKLANDFLDDVSPTAEANRVDPEGLRVDCAFLSSNLGFLKECLRMFTSPPKEARKFYESAERQWRTVSQRRKEVLEQFAGTMQYFGLDQDGGSAESWRSLFGVWMQFSADFRQEFRKIENQRKFKKQAARRRQSSVICIKRKKNANGTRVVMMSTEKAGSSNRKRRIISSKNCGSPMQKLRLD